MPLADLLALVSRHPLPTAIVFAAPALLAVLLLLLQPRGEGLRSPWKYFHATLVYWVCIPGVFVAVLLAYLLLFQNTNLLKLNLLVFFLPLASTGVTLVLVQRAAGSFGALPGFGRLSGLLTMIGLAFAVAFLLHRLRFVIGFFGDFGTLLLIAAAAFVALKLGARRFLGGEKRREPE